MQVVDEKNEWLDRAMKRLLKKTYVSHDIEKVAKCSMTEVDNFGTRSVSDQSIEKRHLAAGISDVNNRRYVRQIVCQLRAFICKVERSH
jgi:hypothetical protein